MRSIDSVSLGGFSGPPETLTRAAAVGGIRQYVIPDLALAAFLVTLFYCLFLFQGYQKLFRDSDAGWHIRTGERILTTGMLPRTDPYSFTRDGQPWFAWEWASDVAAGAIHRIAGLTGVALFYGAIIATGVWLWFRLHWALQGNFLIACAMTPLLLSTCNIHWLARPHVIGWLFLLGCVLYAERLKHAGLRQLLTIAAFTALWANLHASFFLAPVIGLIYWGGCRMPGATGQGPDVGGRGPGLGAFDNGVGLHQPGGHRLRQLERAAVSPSGPRPPASGPGLLAPVLVAAVAPLLNPYGYHLYTHVFRYLTDSDLLSRIVEFQSFDFHALGAGQIIATVILGMIGGALALTLGRMDHFLLAVLLTAMGLRSARGLPLIALLLLPISNAAITRSLERFGKLPGFLNYSARLRAMDVRMSGLAWVPVLLVACFALLRTPGILAATGFAPDQFPVEAYSHIPANARLFAPDKFGGYLIYRSQGGRKVFFDGRSDLYGAGFLKQYARMTQVRPGWRAVWDSFGFTHALLPNDYSLIPALEQSGWRQVYRDGTATLLAVGGTSGGT